MEETEDPPSSTTEKETPKRVQNNSLPSSKADQSNEASDSTPVAPDKPNGTGTQDADGDQVMDEEEAAAEGATPSKEGENDEKADAEEVDNTRNSLSEECEEDSETQDDSLREIIGDLEIDISDPNTPTTKDESTSAADEVEIKEGEDSHTDGQKPLKVKVLNTTELGCCEYCGGPVKRRKLASPLRKFCSKACARAYNKRPIKKRDNESGQDSEESGGGAELVGPESKMTWNDYLDTAFNKAAPDSCFRHVTTDVPGLKPGMKLEAVDRNNPPSFCVATVICCTGHRVSIRYDGYGSDSSNDMWCNYQAEELHPIGWCAQNGYPLQSPKGVGSNLEDWRTFLTQTLTGALAAPQDLFRKGQEIFQPRVHGFEVGMKLEAVHPSKPSIICPATVTKSLGPYYFAITPDYQHELPSTTVCCHSDSPGIFPVGWCYRNGVELTFPANYTKKTFSWDRYLSLCRATVAPSQLFKQKVRAHKFKVGMKVEAVDLEQQMLICVATITNIIGRLLQLFFDGQSRFQFVDVESPDIYPIGWCRKTGHPLFTPFGVMPRDSKLAKPIELEPLHLPSFDEVMGKQGLAACTTSVVIPRNKPVQARDKEKDKCDDKDLDLDDKSGDSDISEDDPLASERFYHNKNQIFFNKTCCIGPLLDPEKVAFLQDATPPGKVSTVIRIGLEMVAKASYDPEKVIDLMQEGCGVRVVVRHKGKLLKKAISRVDSRPKLERYLKRFCRRLICCEYFLSLKPVGSPCPDQCKADEQGNLQGPKGLKAKRSREYFEVKHLGLEKKKRGRKRKSELLGLPASNGVPLMKKLVTENGLPVVKPLLASSVRNRQLAPAYHLQPNGSVVRPAMATGPLPGVQAPVVRFQGPGTPGTLTMVRSTSATPQIAPRPQAIAPAPSNPRLIAPSTTSMVMKKDGPPGHGRTLVMSGPSAIKPRVSQIVTNISGQRFATSSGTAGTTITFGPPNITICSSATPLPLLTRVSDTSVPHGSLPGTITTSGHVTYSRGPPNVVVSSGQSIMTSGGTVQMSVSDVGVPPGGVIRAPIVVPPQVKQESLPPPLLHSLKIPHGSRVQGRTVSPPGGFPLSRAPDGRVPGGPPLYTAPGSSLSIRPPRLGVPTSHPRPFVRAGPSIASQRLIIPNYQGGFPRGAPRPQGVPQGSVPGSLQAPQNAVGQEKATETQGTRTVINSTQGAKPGGIHTVHHNPGGNTSVSPSRSIAMATVPPNVSYSDTATSKKIRPAPISPPIIGTEHLPNSGTDPRSFGNPKKSPANEHHEEGGDNEHEEGGEGKPEVRKKRDLWWLKKKRRKRSRLTLMKPRTKRKEAEEPGPSYIKDEPMEDAAELQDHRDAGSPKTKRSRQINKELVLRLAEEGEGQFPIGDEADPDWDESFERKKIKAVAKKRKATGRGSRKDGSPDLSPSFSANPTSPFLPPSSTDLSDNPYVRRVGSRLVATLPTGSPNVINSSPGLTQPSLSPELPSNRPPVSQKSSRGGRSPSFSAPDGCGRGFSSSHYPPRSAILSSSSSHPPVSPRSPLPARPSGPKRSIGINTSLPGCMNGRSPDVPSNPVTWSVEQVVTYVRSTDCTNYAAIFQEEEIDGQALMMLSRDALMQFTPMKLGPTLKMCSYIAQLKLRAR